MHPLRDRTAFALMSLLGVAAIYAFVRKLGVMDTFDADRLSVEAWRLLGYLVFAGLYFLLAIFPRKMPGIWELVLFHKAGMVLLRLLVFKDPGDDATLSIIVDSILVAVTALSYWLTKGYLSWKSSG